MRQEGLALAAITSAVRSPSGSRAGRGRMSGLWRIIPACCFVVLFGATELYGQEPGVNAPGGVAVGRDNINSPITITQIIQGYTIEQHEARLKAREEELKASFQVDLGRSDEQRRAAERELQGVQGQLGNLQ